MCANDFPIFVGCAPSRPAAPHKNRASFLPEVLEIEDFADRIDYVQQIVVSTKGIGLVGEIIDEHLEMLPSSVSVSGHGGRLGFVHARSLVDRMP
jgi:hypothetical protein